MDPMTLLPLLHRRVGRPLFLPAHGRGAALPSELQRLLKRRAGLWDLPELPMLGGPLEAGGAVAESQRSAAAAMGVDRCWYGVNGATGLLQAALLGICRPGEAVLLPRNAHRSLIQACVLGNLTPLLFDLPFNRERGQTDPPDGPWIESVIAALPQDHPPISAAVLVHPTYQGYAIDPAAVIRCLHRQGWPVLVDEAHGSHFAAGVDPTLPASALHVGADLVVHSLQKSATGLAQTAVLWQQGSRANADAISRSLSWLQTTSPSALLMASCEAALTLWQTRKGQQQLRWRLQEARQLFAALERDGLPLIRNQDPLRLVMHTGQAGINGLEADGWMMERGLVAELPEPTTLTFCLGLARQRGLRRQLRQTWQGLLKAHGECMPQPLQCPPPLPKVCAPERALGSAWRAKRRICPLEQAEGEIAAELLCPYPPGIPLLVPGERLDRPRQQWLIQQRQLWGEQIPSNLAVVDSIA